MNINQTISLKTMTADMNIGYDNLVAFDEGLQRAIY